MATIQKETNKLYRQKYFVEADRVVRYRPPPAGPGRAGSSSIIRGGRGRLDPIRVPMNKPAPPHDAQIAVQVLRKGGVISGIRITCPCGRHAEVDLDYSAPAAGSQPGGAP
ncbi:MAG: hypothetical protein GX548_11520 [Lentisphaerae bacterium]|nr:hypothetical protein [Lentisphaerota bacterium]